MKNLATFLMTIWLVLMGGLLVWQVFVPHVHHTGNEWTMQIKIPPCASVQNIQVLFPAQPGGDVTIECDNVQ